MNLCTETTSEMLPKVMITKVYSNIILADKQDSKLEKKNPKRKKGGHV